MLARTPPNPARRAWEDQKRRMLMTFVAVSRLRWPMVAFLLQMVVQIAMQIIVRNMVILVGASLTS
jgi:hypothetical protein